MRTRGRKQQINWHAVQTAHAAGIGLRELARKMDIPAGTVLARAKREGWTRQIQKARALVASDVQSDAISASAMQSAAMTMAERGQRHVERMAGITEKVVPYVEAMEPGAVLDRIDAVERCQPVAPAPPSRDRP